MKRTVKSRGPGYDVMRALFRNKLAMACLIIILILVLIACTVDLFFDYETDVIGQSLDMRAKPSLEHPFGTDAKGRDYLARTLYAARISLSISVAVNVGVAIIGTFLGGLAAYYGGWFDTLLMRGLDAIMAIPTVLLVICIVAVLGNSIAVLILAFIITSLPGMLRTSRAAFMVSMQNEYVEAAHACGTSDLKIIFGHLLPNSLGPIIVAITMNIGSVITAIAGLGYIGLGVRLPIPEWGRMLSESQQYMRTDLHLLLIPGLFILITATAFNLLGDGIRDATDPRLRGYVKPKKTPFWKRRAK